MTNETNSSPQRSISGGPKSRLLFFIGQTQPAFVGPSEFPFGLASCCFCCFDHSVGCLQMDSQCVRPTKKRNQPTNGAIERGREREIMNDPCGESSIGFPETDPESSWLAGWLGGCGSCELGRTKSREPSLEVSLAIGRLRLKLRLRQTLGGLIGARLLRRLH